MIEQILNPHYSEGALEALSSAVVGHRIVSIERNPQQTREWRLSSYAPDTYGDRALITLDNGAVLQLDGHDGGCSCSAGCYGLTHLADLSEVDNIITAVHFDNRPARDGDGYDIDSDGTGVGYYTIFVVADDRQINLATFEGSDGNGYYGSGYHIRIAAPEVSEVTMSEDELPEVRAYTVYRWDCPCGNVMESDADFNEVETCDYCGKEVRVS